MSHPPTGDRPATGGDRPGTDRPAEPARTGTSGPPQGWPPPGPPQGWPPPGPPQPGAPPQAGPAAPGGPGPEGPPVGPSAAGRLRGSRRPRRSRRALLLSLVALALLAAIVVVVLVGVLGSRVLDRAAVERDVAAQFEQREGVALDLTCGERMVLVTDATYGCRGTTADGEEVTIRITVNDAAEAAYTWAEP